MAAPEAARELPGLPAPLLLLPPPPAVSPAVSDRYPTATDMMAITTTADLFMWAGLTGAAGDRTTVIGAMEESLSGATITDFHFIRDEDFSALLAQVRVQTGDGQRPLTLIEASRARRAHGATAAFILAPPAPGGVLQAPIPPVTKKIKLSSLVDPSADAELVKLSETDVRARYEQYARTRGDHPHPDIEPTDEQLSALHQLIAAGGAPYVDFSIFGPHGKRMLKRLVFTTHLYEPASGSWHRQELPGPPDFQAWWKSWLVFRTAMLLLDASPVEPLDLYGEHIRTFTETYGPQVWFLVYQADVRMRSEEFERLLRRIRLTDAASRAVGGSGLAGFDTRRPWGYIFQQAVHSDNPHTTAFWAKEIKDKALLYQCRLRGETELTSDGTVASRAHGTHSPPRGREGKGRKRPLSHTPREGKGTATSGKRQALPGGKGGGDVCWNYNSGRCPGPCPKSRPHVCAHCGRAHPIIQCFTAPAEDKSWFENRPAPAASSGAPKQKAQGKGKKKTKTAPKS